MEKKRVSKDTFEVKLDGVQLGDMLAAGGAVSRSLAGFEHRLGQVEMVRAVADAFCQNQVLVVEAGTGVGKSLAYGLPAAALALQHSQRVVISSATINLQEQLVNKDFPLVGEVLGRPLKVALVKGRANYLCRRRLWDLTRQHLLVSQTEAKTILPALMQWAETTSDGSRSDLAFPVPEEIWQTVCSDPDACSGRHCPMQEGCFFVAARRKTEQAQLLVVNHHLLFADLALRKQRDNWTKRAVLPPFGRVVLDEAHELEDAASSFFGVRLTHIGVLRILSRLQSVRNRAGGMLSALFQETTVTGKMLAESRAKRLNQEVQESIIPLVESARRAYFQAFGDLSALALELSGSVGGQDARLRFTGEVYGHHGWTAVRESFGQAAGFAADLATNLTRLSERLNDFDQDEARLAELRATTARMQELANQTRYLMSESSDGSVRWAEVDRRQRKRIGFMSAPLDVSELMNETLYEQMDTIVLTSATLSVGGSFDFLCNRLGIALQPKERTRTMLVESPFDFSSQVRLLLPNNLPTPDQPLFEQVLPEVVYQIAMLSGGRALVLFTSWGLLSRVYELVHERLAESGLDVLCQGQLPRHRLLELFRENESSVLFGTDSFWQGVDVIGASLRNVIIVKLPFDVPNEPLIQARMEAARQVGDSPFASFMLPRAVLKLKQGFGRLVRSSTDFGSVVVLDKRLLTKAYGRKFIESLPPATLLVGSLEQVCERAAQFFAEKGTPSPERFVRELSP